MSVPERENNFPTGEDLLAGLTFENMMGPMNSPTNNKNNKNSGKRGNSFPTGDDLLAELTFEDMMGPKNVPVNSNAPTKREILTKLSSGNSNSNPNTFIKNVLANKELKIAYNEYLNTLPSHMLQEGIESYKTITSDNFRLLLEALSQDDKLKLQSYIRNLLSSSKGLKSVSALIYNIIHISVIDSLEGHKRNSRYVYKTAKNVESSEDIESLGLTTMSSILSNFNNYRMFIKESASRSVIFTAELDPNPDAVNVIKARNTLTPSPHTLYFKMYPTGKLNDKFTFNPMGLEAERSMYSELFKLAKYGITPNILCRAATGVFPDAYDELFSSDRIRIEIRQILKTQIQEVNQKLRLLPNDRWKDIGLIITQPGGNTFYDIFSHLDKRERKMVLFQLFYTLYVFEELKISHGDLHTRNLFIIDAEPTELCYVVEGVQYRFTTRSLLKIYDFDQSNISADTDITINGRNTIRINRVFNGMRKRGDYFDREYGKGEQFIRKADLMIFLINCLKHFSHNNLDIGGPEDPETNNFFRTVTPGFYAENPISKKLICDTYTEMLQTATPELIKEFRDVFLIPEGQEIDIKSMKIGENICSMSWNTYCSQLIPTIYGCLVKISKGKLTENNTLMIPDTIVLPMIDMLKNSYFDELKSTEPIDITRQLVYTLDGKVPPSSKIKLSKRTWIGTMKYK